MITALLASTAALAQSAPTERPMVGDRPLVQIKPQGSKAAKQQTSQATGETEAGQAGEAPPSKPAKASKSGKSAAKPPVAAQLQACLEVEDGSKERLDCFDAVFPPKPRASKAGAKQPPAKTAADCRFLKEEDERLGCFNGFAGAGAKPPAQ